MSNPIYSADDYRDAFLALLPRGRAWPRTPGSVQYLVAQGLTMVYARLTADARQLLVGAFPATAYAMLPEWEAALGLPDPNLGPLQTVQQRQAQVLARFAGVGGQSIPYLIAFAKNLGYTITITEYAPARVGRARVGQPLYGPAWAHALGVNAPLYTITQSRVGAAAVGEPLRVWANAPLQVELTEMKPAHTELMFNYA